MTAIPPGITAELDQLAAEADRDIDRLGAAMAASRQAGANEYIVLSETAAFLARDMAMTRETLALALAQAADRLHRALTEQETR